MRLHLIGYFGFATLVFGCGSDGGQSGDLSGNNDPNGETAGGGTCEAHKQKLGSFDEETPAGTPAQILAFAERSFEAPLAWKTARTGAWQLSATGEGTIVLDVTRGASAYYVTYSPRSSGSGAEINIGCPQPALGIDVRVNVSTDDGALDESYDTLLLATSSALATLNVPVDLEALAGTLSVSYASSESELVQVGLNATLMAEGMTGSLAGIEQTTQGDGISAAVGAGAGVLAVWPDSPACMDQSGNNSGLPVTPDQSALGITGNAAAELASGTTPAAVTWLDGSETELTLTAAIAGDGCLRSSGQLGLGESVTYPATFNLSSADGRLNGEYEGRLLTWPSGDGSALSAEATLPLELAQLEESGFSSVEVPDGIERLTVALSLSIEGGEVSGRVALNGLTDPPCLSESPEPMPTPGGGMGSPGCEGTHVTPLEAAAWTAP